MSGFQTGFGVKESPCIAHSRRPATALPRVPSTWIVSRSSRRTRTHHEELKLQMTPFSSSNIA